MFHFQPFNKVKTKELIRFSLGHQTLPSWSQRHMKEFLGELTSSTDLVFDIFDGKKRVAVAALVDNVSNKCNNSCLEFLGLDRDVKVDLLYEFVVHTAKERLPSTRAGIEITIHESSKEKLSVCLHEGFQPYYETFELQNSLDTLKSVSTHMPIVELEEKNYQECYRVLLESFKDNIDICVPNYADWVASKTTNNDSKMWVIKKDSAIIGFISASLDSNSHTSEIGTIGVLPKMRGRGVAKELLIFCLNFLRANGVKNVRLTVATQNRNALTLYQNLGFQIFRHFKILCWKPDPSERKRPFISEMVDLLDRAFPDDDFIMKPVLGIDDDIIVAPNVATLLASPTTVIGTVNKDGKLVAMSVAIPKSQYDPNNPDPKTAYIYYTVVEPCLQGEGLVALAAHSLEEQLKTLGYAYFEQDCLKENGYADKISRAYAGAIIEQYDHLKYPINGSQRFFRIDLNLLPIKKGP